MPPQEQQLIRQRTNWLDEIVRYIGSMDEVEIYIRAGLKQQKNRGYMGFMPSRYRQVGLLHTSQHMASRQSATRAERLRQVGGI